MEQDETDTSTPKPRTIDRPASRWSLVSALRVAIWLVVAAGFGHLFVSATEPIRVDLRAAMGAAGIASLVLASLTATDENRWIHLASTALALGLIVFAGVLIVLRLAHETGLVLLAGCGLNLVLVWLDERAGHVPQTSGSGRQ